MALDLSITFHGATGETTGTRHLLTIDDIPVLLDCGLYQGRRKDTYERNLKFPFAPGKIHSVLLSHAHIDHSGDLPNLVKQGFGGPVYCTPATMDLCRVMLRDSGHIQEKDAEFMTRRFAKRGLTEVAEPLYTQADADVSLERFQSFYYHRPCPVLRDLKALFYDAGHILGSASIICDIRRGEQKYRLAFSGDIGRVNLPLLRDPEVPHNVDWLIMEGTYGAREHDPIADAKAELLDVVKRVAARGGKLIVPSFSVERTQEIVYYLNELKTEGKLPPIPIYVDSPLATNVTEIFRQHVECFDDEARAYVMRNEDPFGFNQLTYVRDVEQSKSLNAIAMPCMIISASGMCEAGRIRHHLANSIEDHRNAIVFVGYQAEGTLGRKIVERKPEVNIFGEPYRLKAEVVTLNAFSGHADKHELFNYAKTVREASPRLGRVFLVHGEQPALAELGGRLRSELQLKVTIPRLGERFELDGE
jgi:metallo-beta-lactamase family protein